MRIFSFPRNLFSLAALCAAIVFGYGSSATDAADQTIKIAVEGVFPPFNYLDSNNQLQGFDVEIAKALCEAAKAHCEFVVQEWDGMIPNLLAKRYDAIISSMSMSLERRQKVAFTQRYYDSPSVFIVRKGSELRSTKPADLKQVKLGVTFSTAQASYVEKFYGDAKTTIYPSSPDLYKGLADGSVDIILEDKLAIYDWLSNTKAGACCEFRGGDIKDPTYFGDGAGIAVRPSDEALREKLDKALEQVKSDGTYDMINAKYFPFSIQ
jgi:polar amino acid transport system substrate-binding protein